MCHRTTSRRCSPIEAGERRGDAGGRADVRRCTSSGSSEHRCSTRSPVRRSDDPTGPEIDKGAPRQSARGPR